MGLRWDEWSDGKYVPANLSLECLTKNAMTARLCHTEIVSVGHKKAGRKNLMIIVCQKYLLIAVSH